MPKIANIQRIDGAYWVQIDDSYLEDHGPITLYTGAELENLKRDVALAICDTIHQMYPKHHESG